jgi:Protein of unknown function (DUF1579)
MCHPPRHLHFVVLLVVVTCGLGLPILAQDQAAGDPLAAMMKLAAPGEHHQHLARLAGDWKAASKMWMEPGAPPIESAGTMHVEPILGGRFVQSQYKGAFLGLNMQGLGLDGYDNVTHKHVGMWIDNMGTIMMTFEGTCTDGGRVTTTTSDFTDPATGKPTTMKSVVTLVDENKFVFEAYMKAAGVPDFVKSVEITYTR